MEIARTVGTNPRPREMPSGTTAAAPAARGAAAADLQHATRRAMGPAEDARVTLIAASRGFSLDVKELWAHRGLLYFLVWRDVKVRYKQTAIGASWAVIQPLMTMVIFTLLFTKVVSMPSDGFPYPIFTYTALLPWNLFAGALTRSSDSLVSQSGLITKVYFPRLIVPLAATIACGVDFALAFIILIGMMAWYAIVPGWGLIALPFFILLAITAAFSIGLWLSALNVRYRDVGHALPFIVQVWVFVSPVAYPTSAVSENWRWVYGLNPMAGVIDGFRWALLGNALPDLTVVLASGLIVAGLLFGGLVFFKRMERSFADVV